jgi:PAS domain-containing protein
VRLPRPLTELLRSGAGGRSLIERLSDPLDQALRVLFEDAVSGVVVLDREARIVRANAALRRLVARRVDLSPGQPGLSPSGKTSASTCGAFSARASKGMP